VHPVVVKFLLYYFGKIDQLLFRAAVKAVANYTYQQRLDHLSVRAEFISRDGTLFTLNGIARAKVNHSLTTFHGVKITQLV
jgi:hypothetical protein